ncbi:MAG: helix-hairpin-helix domain-containing protein [Myxococcaceae bacterium]|nr:helix-hairpin-helix domain-containing protein [Myxococcaceae bacterium]MCI0672109.1 helix-hairpin-helix domain-containing protein [Myxococcaceae bacterium]
MGRVAWMSAFTIALLGAGVAVRLRAPSSTPTLPCAPGEVRVDARGVASCPRAGDTDAGVALPAAALLGLGGRLDLNRATEAELGLLPGVGPSLARELIEARVRTGGFSRWEDVDAVPGVGPARLATLRAHAEIR